MDEEKVEQAIAYAHDVGFDEGYECGYEEGYRDGLAEGVTATRAHRQVREGAVMEIQVTQEQVDAVIVEGCDAE